MWKDLLTSFNMCLSMFTIIPTVKYEWNERLRDKMLICFPIIGLIIGALWFLLYLILAFLVHMITAGDINKISNFKNIIAVLMAIFPVFISGFIHVDGFMDVVDALSSQGDLEKRKSILKDSHVGTFSIVHFVILFVLSIVSFMSLVGNFHFINYTLLIFIPILSRIKSAHSLFRLDKINISEYAYLSNAYTKNIKLYFYIMFILVFFIAAIINIKFAIVLIILEVVHDICILTTYKKFEGVNGDSSGFAIFVSESVAILSMAIIFSI